MFYNYKKKISGVKFRTRLWLRRTPTMVANNGGQQPTRWPDTTI